MGLLAAVPGGVAQTEATASGPAGEATRAYTGLKANILKAADRMPAADYAFKPTPEVRTYARIINHVTEAQLRACSAVNGTTAASPVTVPPETAEKATIVGALMASFNECDKALATATDDNLTDAFTVGAPRRSRIGILFGTVAHDDEQYATLALYLRLKGLVPPSSEK